MPKELQLLLVGAALVLIIYVLWLVTSFRARAKAKPLRSQVDRDAEAALAEFQAACPQTNGHLELVTPNSQVPETDDSQIKSDADEVLRRMKKDGGSGFVP